jgi:hypothetical protein
VTWFDYLILWHHSFESKLFDSYLLTSVCDVVFVVILTFVVELVTVDFFCELCHLSI